MKPLRLGVHGATGRMGLEIRKVADQLHTQVEVFFIGEFLSSKSPRLKNQLDWSELQPGRIDIVIDFTSPEGFRTAVKNCVAKRIPLVSGSTGLASSDFTAIKKAARRIPILWAANMSVGVAMLRRLTRELAQLKGFDFQVEEFHHRHKKDQPSGTAKVLQHDLTIAGVKKLPRELSIRGGGIFGIHRVYAMSESETLVLEHSALHRGVFAEGAVRAARWLATQKPGLYEFENVLSFGSTPNSYTNTKRKKGS